MFIKFCSSLCIGMTLFLSLSSTYTAESEKACTATSTKGVDKHILDYDVIIDIGHGGIDSGAIYDNIQEKHLNLAIGAKIYQQLKEKGYHVGVTRLHDYALSDDSTDTKIKSRHLRDLYQRRMIAESLKPKVFISIHMNASSTRYANGPIILHQKQAESYLLAELLQEELNQLLESKQIMRPSNQLYLLQKISQPCIIAEVGFISNNKDRKKLQLTSFQEDIASRIAMTIDRFFILYP
jgi:N-acetylmuramoyl-L-alanine amidase